MNYWIQYLPLLSIVIGVLWICESFQIGEELKYNYRTRHLFIASDRNSNQCKPEGEFLCSCAWQILLLLQLQEWVDPGLNQVVNPLCLCSSVLFSLELASLFPGSGRLACYSVKLLWAGKRHSGEQSESPSGWLKQLVLSLSILYFSLSLFFCNCLTANPLTLQLLSFRNDIFLSFIIIFLYGD